MSLTLRADSDDFATLDCMTGLCNGETSHVLCETLTEYTPILQVNFGSIFPSQCHSANSVWQSCPVTCQVGTDGTQSYTELCPSLDKVGELFRRAHGQTDRQTDRQTDATGLIAFFSTCFANRCDIDAVCGCHVRHLASTRKPFHVPEMSLSNTLAKI